MLGCSTGAGPIEWYLFGQVPRACPHEDASPTGGLWMDILVIEDDQDTLDAYQMFFALEGFRVRCAGTGAEAEDIMRTTPIDVVLLDLTLPDTDGRDLAERLRALAAPRLLPTLALTGHRLDRAAAAKFCCVMRKPIDLAAVLAWLRGQPPSPALELFP